MRAVPKRKRSATHAMSMAEIIAREREKRGLTENPASSLIKGRVKKVEVKKEKTKKKKKKRMMPTAEDLAALQMEDTSEEVSATTIKALKTSPQLVKYTDTCLGQGDGCVVAGSSVLVEYSGKVASTGHCFDRSTASAPLQFGVGSGTVIEGFEDGVLGMKLGGKRTIIVPSKYGYGEEGLPGMKIPPNAQLRFGVRLVGLS